MTIFQKLSSKKLKKILFPSTRNYFFPSKFWELECCKQSSSEETRLSWSPNPEKFLLSIPEAVIEGDGLLDLALDLVCFLWGLIRSGSER